MDSWWGMEGGGLSRRRNSRWKYSDAHIRGKTLFDEVDQENIFWFPQAHLPGNHINLWFSISAKLEVTAYKAHFDNTSYVSQGLRKYHLGSLISKGASTLPAAATAIVWPLTLKGAAPVATLMSY